MPGEVAAEDSAGTCRMHKAGVTLGTLPALLRTWCGTALPSVDKTRTDYSWSTLDGLRMAEAPAIVTIQI